MPETRRGALQENHYSTHLNFVFTAFMILGTPVHVSLNGDDRMLRRTFGFFPCCPHMHWWVRPPLSPSSVQLHILKLDFTLPPSKINWSRGSSLQPAPSLNCLRLFLVLVLQKEVNLWFNLMRDRHIEQKPESVEIFSESGLLTQDVCQQ